MKWITLLAIAMMSINSIADSFYVEEVKGSESSQDKNAVRELIRMSIPKNHSAVSNAKQAQWILTPQLLKLGDSYILSIEKTNTKTKASNSERMKSSSMSNMDLTAQRLTEAVINEVKVADTGDVTNITENEKKQNTNRIEATRQWVIGLGPSWTSNLNSSGGGFTFLLGYEWGLDPDFSIDISYVGTSGRKDDDSSFSDFSIGGSYYLNRTKFSPFANVRLGYGSSDINDGCTIFCTPANEESSGWTGSLAVGYKLFRTSTVNVAPLLRYSYIFDKGDLGNAAMTSVLIAVYY